MAKINEVMEVPLALALEFEGRAKDAGMSAEKYLKTLMNKATYSAVTTTQLQRDIISGVESGDTDAEIAQRQGCSRHYVIQVRNKMGLPPNPERVRL